MGRPPNPIRALAAADARRDLEAALFDYAEATARMERATRARAVAVWWLHDAGCSTRAIAAEVGVSQPMVVQILRSADRWLGGLSVRPRRRVRSAPAPTVPEPPGGPLCLREGCPHPRSGPRFCAGHQWS